MRGFVRNVKSGVLRSTSLSMRDKTDRTIKLGHLVRHFFNGQWYVEYVGWAYDSILQRRHYVYKPSGLSVKYSAMTHDASMATGYKPTKQVDKNGHRLYERASPEIIG